MKDRNGNEIKIGDEVQVTHPRTGVTHNAIVDNFVDDDNEIVVRDRDGDLEDVETHRVVLLRDGNPVSGSDVNDPFSPTVEEYVSSNANKFGTDRRGALRDLLTQIIHETDRRGFSFNKLFEGAQEVYREEGGQTFIAPQLDNPISEEEARKLYENAGNEYPSFVISVGLFDLLNNDIEGLNVIAEEYIGGAILSDINYKIVGISQGNILVEVTADFEFLDSNDEPRKLTEEDIAELASNDGLEAECEKYDDFYEDDYTEAYADQLEDGGSRDYSINDFLADFLREKNGIKG
jgi:hypothetical protein